MRFLFRFLNVARHQENVSASSQMREQAALLDNITNSPTYGADSVVGNRLAIKLYRTRIRPHQSDDQTKQS